MKYVYKIQWVFEDVKRFSDIIKILGARSMDSINLRDDNFKVIDNYNGFIMHPFGVAESETIKYVKKQIKNNNKIKYIEVLRK